MAQIRNRFDIQQQDESKQAIKKLPSLFEATDEVPVVSGITLSLLLHIAFAFLLLMVTALSGLIFPHLPKPELTNRDMEFKLVQNESQPPINKKTKIRSDRDSRAGGIHDPKKAISEPSPAQAATPAKKPAQPKQMSKPQPQPKVQPQPQPVVKPTPQPIAKPKSIQAPSAKPTVKPAAPSAISKPSAVKPVVAPKSPFAIATPATKAPVGSTYRPATGSAGGSGVGTSSGAPAPRFSSSGAGTGTKMASGASGGSYARGGGSGQAGNPSPGNPNGRPGIDALKQPNWGPYMRDLEQRIKRNWTPPKGDSSKRVVITFVIGRDGRLLSKKVTKSSGVPLADNAAMKAIELTAPFRPLPPEFKGSSVPIEFTFDYNVLNSVLK